MLENLANFGEFLGGVAVILSLIYLGFQLNQTRKQLRADALQQQISTRLQIWNDQLDKTALRTAQEKMFEHELYRRDVMFHELEQLTYAERQAMLNALQIELVYFQSLFHQQQNHIIDEDQSLPVNYMRIFTSAPNRRQWKDWIRLLNHFPPDYVRHVDTIVKKYDDIEGRMDEDQDADFESLTQEVFDIPAPPDWLNR